MVKKTIEYVGNIPFHIRPIGVFTSTVQASNCEVTVTKGDLTINGNSAMQLMKLSIVKGDCVTISVDGTKENSILETLVQVILNS